MNKSLTEQRIISWLDRLGPDGLVQFRRSRAEDGVEIILYKGRRGRREVITLEVLCRADSNVLVPEVERLIGEVEIER